MRKPYLAALLLFYCHQISLAQWNTNPAVNNMLCADAPNIGQSIGNTQFIRMVNDGSGGAYVCWFDQRSTAPLGGMDVILQHISASGVITWPANGINISNADYNQRFPEMASDGNGGVVVTWYSDDDSKVYAQRVDVNGNLLWGSNAIPVCAAASGQFYPNILKNENGDFTIVWKDTRTTGDFGLYAQRLDINGNLLWSSNGVLVCNGSTPVGGVRPAQMISDGNNGVIICWDDNRSSTKIFAQRILQNGTAAWTADGVAVSGASASAAVLCADGNGGAIVSWTDNRSPFTTKNDIYVQHIDGNGNLLWSSSGIPLCTAPEPQYFPQIVSDNSGGAIVSWQDYRTGSNTSLYAQRINGTGTILWPADGLLITDHNSGSYQKMTKDEAGGMLITWANISPYNLRAQHLSPSGVFLFAADGAIVSSQPASGGAPEIISIGAGNSIIAWVDYRNSGQVGIFASRLLANGTLPLGLLSFSGRIVNDQNKLTWTVQVQNQLGFDIERSADGMQFEKIGYQASLNTAAAQTSQFTDQPSSLKNYYRLKQIDMNHNFKYSNIILLDRAKKNNELFVFPNPAGSFITVQCNGAAKGLIRILDVSGRVVKTQDVKDHSILVNIHQLRPGTYYCNYDGQTISFLKQE